MAYLVNPKAPDAQSLIKQVQMAGAATGTKIQVLEASSDAELDVAFTAVKQSRALVVSNESIFITRRDRVVALAAQHALPACYPFREFVLAGGLMSYGPDRRESYRQAGVYAARILKGAKPADLPVVQATKIEITFNPATAKKLGLVISRDFFARVDEVIQ
jgi:putative ABC transport system substrate-binding protein